jgi:hypothetical protein
MGLLRNLTSNQMNTGEPVIWEEPRGQDKSYVQLEGV